MMDNSDYYEFCDCIGVAYKYSEADHLLECFYEYVDIERNFNNYIYKYVMLMNSMSHHEEYYCTSEYLRDIIETQLSAVSIPYEIIKDDDGYFIFPKGAEELPKLQ